MDIKVLASGSRGNAYFVSDGVTPLLLECGIPIKQIRQGLNFGLSDVAACLISHEHKDYSKAIRDVLRMGVNIYTSKGTIDAMGLQNHRIRPVKDKDISCWNMDYTSVRD